MTRNIVVVGCGFAGLSAALELGRRLSPIETVTVISLSRHFIFLPSLIWVAQGWREIDEISFDVTPVLAEAGIGFVQAALEEIDPDNKLLKLNTGSVIAYDKVLLTTGGLWSWDIIPGLQPKSSGGELVSIFSPKEAMNARPYWQAFLEAPGPAVIGLMPNASLYGAAYEFALSLAEAVRHRWGREKVDLTFVTPEPFLGHFGHGGLGNSRSMLENAFSGHGIKSITKAQVTHVQSDAVILVDGSHLPSTFTMLVPPQQGIQPIRKIPGLTDVEGRIPVDGYYRSLQYPGIFAAGGTMRIEPKVETLFPCGVFVPGVVSAEMGRAAAANIAADYRHGSPMKKRQEEINAFYVLDSGVQGLFVSLGPQSWLNLQINLPGPWSRWAKVLAEKYRLRQLQMGNY